MLDPVAVERAESEIDHFIQRRAREKADANRVEELFAESERRHQDKRRRENRDLWRSYHLDQAERLERTAASIAEEHRARAAALAVEEEAS